MKITNKIFRIRNINWKKSLTIRGEGSVSLLGTDMESDVISVQNSEQIVFDNLIVKHTNPPKTQGATEMFSVFGTIKM